MAVLSCLSSPAPVMIALCSPFANTLNDVIRALPHALLDPAGNSMMSLNEINRIG